MFPDADDEYLTIDTRLPHYGSVIDADFDDEDEGDLKDDQVECEVWRPITPPVLQCYPAPTFVDGIQHVEARISSVGTVRPAQGRIVAYAAGAVRPAQHEWPSIELRRKVIMGGGKICEPITVKADNGDFTYAPDSTPASDPKSLDARLRHLRAELEAGIVRRLIAAGHELVVVDGRLPVDATGAIGLIKTPHLMPLTRDYHFRTLDELLPGQRSPLFVRTRSGRDFFSWFVALAPKGPFDPRWSNLAFFETDTNRESAEAGANFSCSLVQFAPAAARDARAPQNLLPVGELERKLRAQLGDREFSHRLLLRAFAEARPRCK